MKKIRVIFVIILLSLFGYSYAMCSLATSGSSTYYVDSEKGDDSNDGLSPQTPWRTIVKVNTSIFQPGDNILFKRGGIWRDSKLIVQSGDSSNAIIYGAYGIGDKPQIRRSFTANCPSDWVDEGNNIWKSIHSFEEKEASNIVFNEGTDFGVWKWNEADLDTQGDFWADTTNKIMKFYSVGNPAAVYNSIEIVIHEASIRFLRNKAYVTVENLHPCYSGYTGIGTSKNVHDITIRNCDVSFIGGGRGGRLDRRLGNGINLQHQHLWNISIMNNKIWQCYDAGISIQGGATNLNVSKIYFRNNIIWDCGNSFEFWAQDSTAILHDIYFEHNTCLFAGGWGQKQRTTPRGIHLMIWVLNGTINDIYIRNNIFYKGDSYLAKFNYYAPESQGITIDYNCWYKASGDAWCFLKYWDPNWKKVPYFPYKLDEFTAWKNDTGFDAHSIADDPLLKKDFHLQTNSPCIDAGTDVGLTEDFEGNPRPRGSASDIGVYEYIGRSISISASELYSINSRTNTGTIVFPWPSSKPAYYRFSVPEDWDRTSAMIYKLYLIPQRPDFHVRPDRNKVQFFVRARDYKPGDIFDDAPSDTGEPVVVDRTPNKIYKQIIVVPAKRISEDAEYIELVIQRPGNEDNYPAGVVLQLVVINYIAV